MAKPSKKALFSPVWGGEVAPHPHRITRGYERLSYVSSSAEPVPTPHLRYLDVRAWFKVGTKTPLARYQGRCEELTLTMATPP